jgi:hypothetical protein
VKVKVMATFRKRGDKYHVQVRPKGHEPVTASFDRLTDEKEWAAIPTIDHNTFE